MSGPQAGRRQTAQPPSAPDGVVSVGRSASTRSRGPGGTTSLRCSNAWQRYASICPAPGTTDDRSVKRGTSFAALSAEQLIGQARDHVQETGALTPLTGLVTREHLRCAVKGLQGFVG